MQPDFRVPVLFCILKGVVVPTRSSMPLQQAARFRGPNPFCKICCCLQQSLLQQQVSTVQHRGSLYSSGKVCRLMAAASVAGSANAVYRRLEQGYSRAQPDAASWVRHAAGVATLGSVRCCCLQPAYPWEKGCSASAECLVSATNMLGATSMIVLIAHKRST